MRRFLCTTCGTQFPESEAAPLPCPICEGERAILVLASGGNLLWDCTSPFHDEIAARVEEIGGIAAISISHPHYYSSMVEWAEAFDAPIYPARRRPGVGHAPERSRRLLVGETRELGPGLTLVRCGGHYEGGTVLHWAAGAEGRGALLSGDIVQVIPDRAYVSFMYSYPNLIPLGEPAIRGSWRRSSRLTSTESTAPGGIASSRRMRRPSSPARRSAT
jgi:glyoxylase-like metal-dependent hydrolase (beta-lactamase superfamily II)